ncbi:MULTISPECIES: prephenate dehydrogenase/arogenate dehydrogenase family protein [unclassified Beijerinckia]|uniref:prephenate dehydrogenase/arogenate dehydrogenase family protein n=1 Tax=unclassified Beijerinckia TaxID=2638183 RepID=UPI000B8230DE|nr:MULTISPECIES: prephenate dehydrogenase/arogenate dehydrogenase family protein [unclassified Beijerinckia]
MSGQSSANPRQRPRLGLIGFGAFGRLMAEHLHPFFDLRCHDPKYAAGDAQTPQGVTQGVTLVSLSDAARCPIVVLAMPVAAMAQAVAAIAPHLLPGVLVLDVGSVKTLPAQIMAAGLPAHVDVVGTHPLFGPQSARNGLAGLKIALCPIRGQQTPRIAAFLRRHFALDVIVTTPEAHDREAAAVQGLTHLIAKVLVQMEPLPSTMTTRSFDLLMEGINMVRDDAPEVFDAIERLNPFAAEMRRKFFGLAAELAEELENGGKAQGGEHSSSARVAHAAVGESNITPDSTGKSTPLM